AEDGIRDGHVTGVQTCALPIFGPSATIWNTADRVMGIVGGGGHAEFLCVHEREAIRVPKEMPWEEAAAIPEAFLTAYDALFTRRSEERRVGKECRAQ